MEEQLNNKSEVEIARIHFFVPLFTEILYKNNAAINGLFWDRIHKGNGDNHFGNNSLF